MTDTGPGLVTGIDTILKEAVISNRTSILTISPRERKPSLSIYPANGSFVGHRRNPVRSFEDSNWDTQGIREKLNLHNVI